MHSSDCLCLICVPACAPPTKTEFDALSTRWRRYVADLETNCSPGDMVRENAMLRDRVSQLEALVGNPGRTLCAKGTRGCGAIAAGVGHWWFCSATCRKAQKEVK